MYLFIYFGFAFFKNNFYWSIVDLQCCVNFRCIAKWISYTYAYIHSFLDSLQMFLWRFEITAHLGTWLEGRIFAEGVGRESWPLEFHVRYINTYLGRSSHWFVHNSVPPSLPILDSGLQAGKGGRWHILLEAYHRLKFWNEYFYFSSLNIMEFPESWRLFLPSYLRNS